MNLSSSSLLLQFGAIHMIRSIDSPDGLVDTDLHEMYAASLAKLLKSETADNDIFLSSDQANTADEIRSQFRQMDEDYRELNDATWLVSNRGIGIATGKTATLLKYFGQLLSDSWNPVRQDLFEKLNGFILGLLREELNDPRHYSGYSLNITKAEKPMLFTSVEFVKEE